MDQAIAVIGALMIALTGYLAGYTHGESKTRAKAGRSYKLRIWWREDQKYVLWMDDNQIYKGIDAVWHDYKTLLRLPVEAEGRLAEIGLALQQGNLGPENGTSEVIFAGV